MFTVLVKNSGSAPPVIFFPCLCFGLNYLDILSRRNTKYSYIVLTSTFQTKKDQSVCDGNLTEHLHFQPKDKPGNITWIPLRKITLMNHRSLGCLGNIVVSHLIISPDGVDDTRNIFLERKASEKSFSVTWIEKTEASWELYIKIIQGNTGKHTLHVASFARSVSHWRCLNTRSLQRLQHWMAIGKEYGQVTDACAFIYNKKAATFTWLWRLHSFGPFCNPIAWQILLWLPSIQPHHH